MSLLLCFLIFFPTYLMAQTYGTQSTQEIETKLCFSSFKEIDTRSLAVNLKKNLQKKLKISFKQEAEFNSARKALKLIDYNRVRNDSTALHEERFIRSLERFKLENHKNHILQVEDFLSKKVRISPYVKSFIFEDTYLDSNNFDLYQNNALYRLRYRFNSKVTYHLYQLLQIKPFYPIRCEIQSKINSKKELDFFTANESRFEFRNESSPFSIPDNPAPEAPWKKKKYLKIASQGLFKNKLIQPMAELKKTIPISELTPQVKLITSRQRFHLYLPTPWGSGPNPSQLFIISLDHVKAECLTAFCSKKLSLNEFYELEIELDRNTYKNVQKKIQDMTNLDNNVTKRVRMKSVTFEKKLKNDLRYVSNLIHTHLKKTLKEVNFLETSSKYQRVFK